MDQDGVETVEMVILMVVIVGIAVVMREQLVKWFNHFLGQAQQAASQPGEAIVPAQNVGK